MRDELALQRYLQRHIEQGLPDSPLGSTRWHHVLVIPAYRESATLLQSLALLRADQGKTLVILVLNRPDSDPDTCANAELRRAIDDLSTGEDCEGHLLTLNPSVDVYALDMESSGGPIPADLGVGLARKTGCDLALKWIAQGAIDTPWICSTDADALLPSTYFEQLTNVEESCVAAALPFQHLPGPDTSCNEATALYELRLHHYVLGLQYAGSPYAHHTLGSCLAVKAGAYAHVRGFPKRAGAEDFYLLGKLAKLGAIANLQGECIALQSRRSTRVPFGTGPAVSDIAALDNPAEAALFYHPQCFEALRVLMVSIPSLAECPDADLPTVLATGGLDEVLAAATADAMQTLGLDKALQHCARQSKSAPQFQRHFHQWFDAFRTLKLIHALRDAGWPQQPLGRLNRLQPQLWPPGGAPFFEVERLRSAIRAHWHWRSRQE